MKYFILSTCVLATALGTACAPSTLDPIKGGVGGAGGAGGAGGVGGAGGAVVPRDPRPLWSKIVTGSPADGNILDESGYPVVAADGLGNTVVFASERGSRGTPLDSFDSDGNHRWSKVIDRDTAGMVDMAVNRSGLVAITGWAHGSLDLGGGPFVPQEGSDTSLFAGVFNADGDHIWSNLWDAGPESTGISGDHIGIDAAGNVTITGLFNTTIDFGGVVLPDPSVGESVGRFIAKFDPAGHPLWAKQYSYTTPVYIHAMAVDGSGNVVVVADLRETADFGGGPLVPTCSPRQVICKDIVMFKLDAAGNHLWSKRLGTGDVALGDIATDGSGNIALVGGFRQTLDLGDRRLESPLRSGDPANEPDHPQSGGDIFVIKLDPEGDLLWAKDFRANNTASMAWGVAVADSGDIALTGGEVTGYPVDFGTGPLGTVRGGSFVAKLDAAGNALWAAHSDGNSYTRGTSVATDGSGNVIAAGLFKDYIDFGAGGMTADGERVNEEIDGFIVKFAP